MNPPAPAIPAAASPPATPAPASGGLTRRRKLLLAAEAAGIAGILVFAWMRPTAEALWIAQVRAIGEGIRARYTPGMTEGERVRVDATVRRDLNFWKTGSFDRSSFGARTIAYRPPGPSSLFPLRFAARPRPPSNFVDTSPMFWIDVRVNSRGEVSNAVAWHGHPWSGSPDFELPIGSPVEDVLVHADWISIKHDPLSGHAAMPPLPDDSEETAAAPGTKKPD